MPPESQVEGTGRMYINDQHKNTIELAQKAGIRLQLHSDSICTACQYLHRFYHFMEKMRKHSTLPENNQDYDTGIVVSTCIYIACKTNENHVRLSELISAVHFHLTEEQQESTVVKLNYDDQKLLAKDKNYWKLRDSVVLFELLVLRILEFNLNIDLPHKYLIFYLKSLGDWIHDESLIEELFQLSWSLVNDYCCNHPESIKWQANHSALACIELAISVASPSLKNVIENKPTSSKLWYTNFDKSLKQDSISVIIDQILTACTATANKLTTK